MHLPPCGLGHKLFHDHFLVCGKPFAIRPLLLVAAFTINHILVGVPCVHGRRVSFHYCRAYVLLAYLANGKVPYDSEARPQGD